jgi:hypothetical protein
MTSSVEMGDEMEKRSFMDRGQEVHLFRECQFEIRAGAHL